MFRSFIFALTLILGTAVSAKTTVTDVVASVGHQAVMSQVDTFGLNLKKGDQAKYNLQIASFIKGSMEMNVLDVIPDGVWIQQNMDLGFAGKQDIRQLIDPNTGEIKKYIVNGQEQAPPAAGDMEIIESKEDTIRVPAGTFTCLYVKAKVTQNNQPTEVEQWMNPKAVPVMGMVKMVAQSQLGPVTAELTSFKRM